MDRWPGEFEEEAKTNLFISCGRWKNDVYNLPLKLLMTYNPSKNFLYRDYKDFKKGMLDKEVYSKPLPRDNKMLPWLS